MWITGQVGLKSGGLHVFDHFGREVYTITIELHLQVSSFNHLILFLNDEIHEKKCTVQENIYYALTTNLKKKLKKKELIYTDDSFQRHDKHGVTALEPTALLAERVQNISIYIDLYI